MKARVILILLLAFLGIGALFGGGMFLISPSGSLFQMPLGLLKGSPFHDFFFPGLILFLVLGVVPCILVFALIKKPVSRFAQYLNFYPDMYWGWSFSIYVAFALIIWIHFEMVFLQHTHWLQTLYMFWAIAIIFIALLPQVRSDYKTQIKF